MPLDCEESVGHSCGCPFGLSSETGLLVTTSFSGSDRMDNVLKDHRCPILPRFVRTGGIPLVPLSKPAKSPPSGSEFLSSWSPKGCSHIMDGGFTCDLAKVT